MMSNPGAAMNWAKGNVTAGRGAGMARQAPATAAELTPQSSRLQQALARNRRGKTYQAGQQAGVSARQARTNVTAPPASAPAPAPTAARQPAPAPTAAPAPGSWMPQRWQDARFALQQQPGAGALGARGPEEWAQAARLMKPELYAAGGAGLLGAGALVGRATAPEPTFGNMVHHYGNRMFG